MRRNCQHCRRASKRLGEGKGVIDLNGTSIAVGRFLNRFTKQNNKVGNEEA